MSEPWRLNDVPDLVPIPNTPDEPDVPVMLFTMMIHNGVDEKKIEVVLTDMQYMWFQRLFSEPDDKA